MKTGIFYDNLRGSLKEGESPLILLDRAARAGAEFIECDWGFVKKQKNVFFERLKRFGLGLCAYAFTDIYGIFASTSPIEADFFLMKHYGITRLLLVCGLGIPSNFSKADAQKKAVATVSRLCKTAAQFGITVTFEDFGSRDIPCGCCEDMTGFKEAIPELMFTLDTGNFYCFGEELLPSYEKLKGRIAHVHIKDHETTAPDSLCCVPGKGVIPLDEAIRRLIADGYDGWMSVEIYDVASTEDNFRDSIAYVKKSVEKETINK